MRRTLGLLAPFVTGLALLVPGTAVSAAPTTATVTAPATSVDLDPSDRESMRRGWLEVLKPALQTPIGWTGDLATCDAGAPSAAAQDATLTAVNYFRDVVGVEPVTFDPALSAQAQQAALIMAANGQLSHSPPSTWSCWTADGSAAAGQSNLALGNAGASAVLAYMADDGSGNAAAGHRRWLIDPRQTTMGSGSVQGGGGWQQVSNALYVLDTASWQPVPASTPQFLPWPAAGYMPVQIAPGGRWSLSAGRAASFAGASVTVNGTSSGIAVQPVQNGYGPNTLVWDFDPGFKPDDPDRTYHVVVSGIQSGDVVFDYSYDVTLFDAEAQPAGDLDPPVVTALRPDFTVGLGKGDFQWEAADQSGVQEYQVRRSGRRPSLGFGAWTVADWSGSPGWGPLKVSPGETWCASLRARDTNGNVSAWSAPECVHTPVDDRDLTASQGWRTEHDAVLWHGSAQTSRAHGATVALKKVSGVDRVGVVAGVCPRCGTVGVYAGRTKLGTIDLQADRDFRVIRMLPRLTTPVDGPIRIVVESSNRKVQIDGVAVASTSVD